MYESIFNETSTDLTVLESVHKVIVIPSLLLVYVSLVLITLVIGLAVTKTSQGRGKFLWSIWFPSIILIGLIVFSMILFPSIIEFVVSFLGITP